MEAKYLFPGATILEELTPRRVVTLTEPRGAGPILARIEGGPEPLPAMFNPEQHVLLCVEHKVRWTVHYQERARQRPGYGHRSVPLSAPYVVRDFWPYRTDHLVVTRLIEHHTTISSTPVAFGELPGPGEAAEAAPDGAKVHYRLLHGGPAVLRTGDDVRAHLCHRQEIHDREHRPQWGGRTHDPDMSTCGRCVRTPHDLTPMRVTITMSEHEITPADLPDCEYELGAEAAYRRITGSQAQHS